jgi:hypothetical protein
MTNTTLKLTAISLLAFALIGCGGDSGSSTAFKNNTPPINKEKDVDLRSFKINYKNRNDIKITWDKVKNVASYEVKIDEDMLKLGLLPQYTLNPQLNWVDVSQLPNGKWWISVRAQGSDKRATTVFTITENSAFIGTQKDSDKGMASSFTNSMISGTTWDVNGTVNTTSHKSFTVTFNQNGSINNSYDGTGMGKTYKWSIKGGKLYTTYSLYGTTLDQVVFTITGEESGCYRVVGDDLNSEWSANYLMCRQ